MNENIVKPATLARRELIDKLVEVINESQLPMFVITPILEDLLAEVKSVEQKEYEADKAQYEQQLAQAKTE